MCRVVSRRLPRLAAAMLVLAAPLAAQQQSTDTFRWMDFHSPKDENIVVWVTRSLEVEKWTAIREIGVLYDAALVVTTDRATPQSPPGDDSFTIWNVSLTSHAVTPLLKGVNLRWFDPQRFAAGASEELTVLYDNCRDCAASTYFTAFHYDFSRHMWAARWMRGGQGVPVWNAKPPGGIVWSQVYALMTGADGLAQLCTWNRFDYGREKRPTDILTRYDVDPLSGLERTVTLSGKDAQAMELRLCLGEDAVQGLERGQDSALCSQFLNTRPQRMPVTTPPANNRGQSVPSGVRH
jgi:hypothetical protein